MNNPVKCGQCYRWHEAAEREKRKLEPYRNGLGLIEIEGITPYCDIANGYVDYNDSPVPDCDRLLYSKT